MLTSTRCSPRPSERVVAGQRQRRRRDPLPGDGLVHPVAGRRRQQRAPRDAEQRASARRAAVDVDGERQHPPGPRLAVDSAAPAGGTPSWVPPPCRARWPPTGAARRRLRRARLPTRAGRGGAARRRQQLRRRAGRAGSSTGHSSLISGRRRGSARARARSTGSSTAEPVAHPPVEPGRLTTSVRPATPGEPAREHRGRARRRRHRPRGWPRRYPAPRGRATARVASGVPSVGVSPVPPVVRTHVGRRRRPPRAARPRPRARRARRPGRRRRSPTRRSASTRSGPPRSG